MKANLESLNEMVRTKTLNEQGLVDLVFGKNGKDSTYWKERKNWLIDDLHDIMSVYDTEEIVIIYCFARLWLDNKTYIGNFSNSYEKHIETIINIYQKDYYTLLKG